MTGEDIGRLNLDELRESRRATLRRRLSEAEDDIMAAIDRDDWKAIERLTRRRDYWQAELDLA